MTAYVGSHLLVRQIILIWEAVCLQGASDFPILLFFKIFYKIRHFKSIEFFKKDYKYHNVNHFLISMLSAYFSSHCYHRINRTHFVLLQKYILMVNSKNSLYLGTCYDISWVITTMFIQHCYSILQLNFCRRLQE